MPKSSYTRSSSRTSGKKSGKKSIRRTSSSLTLDQKLNFIGVLMIVLGVLGFVAFFSDKNGQFNGWLALTMAQIAGWGGIILPLVMVIGGVYLLFRHFERLPRISGGRITGVILLYLNLLTWFHYISATGFAGARAGKGGGFIGAGFDTLLTNSLGSAGEVVVLIAWFLIGLIFVIDISIPDLISRISGGVRKISTTRQATTRQPTFSFSQPHSRPAVDQPDGELPEGFKALDLNGNPPRVISGRPGREQTHAFPASSSQVGSSSTIPTDTAPVIHTGVTKPIKPWPIPAVADILDPATPNAVQTHLDKERVRKIEETLKSFGAPAHIVEIHHGPAITQFGVEPDFIETRAGRTRVRVAKIVSLEHDLALVLAAPSIRIQAPVPGKAYIGIEVPNTELSLVTLRELMETEAFKKLKSSLRIALGKDVAGKPIYADLASLPHLLVAGTTNSGKSVLVNSILASLLLNNSPAELRLVLVDPKRVELTGYNGIPHLLAPVVVDAERVVGALQWVLREMESRYTKFSNAGARNIADYNQRTGDHVPYLVVVIDELADLMMLAPDETERCITRLAQMSRATGIHLIISTQRPSVDVLTGLIKANLPARVSFMVVSNMDSRVILDKPGADKLLGRGDMLYQAPDAPAPVRLQGVFVSNEELQRLVDSWRVIAMNRAAEGGEEPTSAALEMAPSGIPLKQGDLFGRDSSISGDPMLPKALDVVRAEGGASISMLQRKLGVGYTRAARLIDKLEEQGMIGPQQKGSQVREVLDYGEPETDKEAAQ